MPRENAEARGKRYLTEGRLIVDHVSNGRVLARCRGTGATWNLGFLNGVWFCECPARTRCSHRWALALVTSVQTPDDDERHYSNGADDAQRARARAL